MENVQKAHVESVASLYNDVFPFLWEAMKGMEGEESAYNMHVGLFNNSKEPYLSAQQRIIYELIETLNLSENKKVLDVGCGAGLPAIRISEKYNCQIEGITISRKQIEVANELLKKFNVKRVNFTQMDAHHIVFPENSFDEAYALESLSHMDRTLVFKELYKVLNKHAKFVACDFYMKMPLTDKEEKILKDEYMTTLITLDELHKQLLESGFKNIYIKDWSDRVYPTYKHWEKIGQNITNALSLRNVEANQDNKAIGDSFVVLTQLLADKTGYFMVSAESSK